jgi:hypothetical protein
MLDGTVVETSQAGVMTYKAMINNNLYLASK